MASTTGHEVPVGLPQSEQAQETDNVATAPPSGGQKVAGDYRSSDPPPSSLSPSDLLPEASGSAKVKTTRTRTVKSRDIFTPEDQSGKKVKGRTRGRRKKCLYRGSDLKNLLEDEKADPAGKASSSSKGGGQRKRSRNASDEENRWDHIRTKVKGLLQKIRRDTHFIQVYQQDGWKSCGREKLKPTIELEKAKARVRGVKTELRQVAKRLTEMNCSGSRWGDLQQDEDGNINVDEVVCTKCNQGHSDDHDDILLCDYAGCFRAYHQNCLTPSVKPEAFPNEEEDWFCWQCECLTDCLEMIEDEFPGRKFESWEEVFPDMEGGAASGSRQDQDQDVMTDSEDSDDESFKGSNTESEGEDAVHRGSENGDNHSHSAGSGAGREGDGNVQDEGTGDDEDMAWMSDAESVGSDEVAKLHSEAADMADMENDVEPSGGAGSRAGRARSRRKLRSKALGLTDDTPADRALAAAIVRGEKIDTANIMEGRRRRKTVDYVKLNEAVFGDDEVYGDEKSSDPKNPEVSAAYGSDFYEEGSECHEDSDASELARKKCKPKRKNTPSIDPSTGERRKRGRPRKSETTALANGSGAAGGQPKRKPGRPKKSAAGATAAKHHFDKMVHIDSVPATATDDIPRGRKPGRPKKSTAGPTAAENHSDNMAHIDSVPATAMDDIPRRRAPGVPTKETLIREHGAGSNSGKRRRGRPRKSDLMPDISPKSGSKDASSSGTGNPNSGRPGNHGSQVPVPNENATGGGTEISTEKRKPGRPRKHAATPGTPQGGVSVGGAGKNAVELVPAQTEATASMLDSSRAGVVEEGAIRTNEKCKPGRPKNDGALAGSFLSKSGAGGAGSNPAKRPPAQPIQDVSLQGTTPASMSGGGTCSTSTEKRKRGRPRKDGGSVKSRPEKSSGDDAGGSAGKRPPAQHGTNKSSPDPPQADVPVEGAINMIERCKPGRPKKDGGTPDALQGDVRVGSTGCSAARRPPSQSVKGESTLDTAQAGVLGGGRSGLTEKRKRGRPRKDGGSSSSPRGRVGVGGTTNNVEKRAHAQTGTDRSNVGTGSSQASGIEESVSNIAQKRKPGRPRKDEASSDSREKVVLTDTNSTGKRANAQPGTEESIPSTTQARRIEGDVSTSKGKRSLGWTAKDGATSASTNGDVGVDGTNCCTVQRPNPHPGQEKMAQGSHEGVMVMGGSSSTTENRMTSQPRNDGTMVGSRREGVGWKDPNLVAEEGSNCVTETLKLNRDTKPDSLPDAQHKSHGNGGANVSDYRKPSQSWEEEAIRGALRRFIAADGASCGVGKSNSGKLEEDRPISSIPEKNMPGRPKKHAEASNAPLHEVNEGGSDHTGKRKPGRPKKDGAMLEDGSGSSAGKRKPGRPKKDGAMLADGSGSSAGKRKPGRPKKDGAMLADGSGSSAGKRKRGRPKKNAAASETLRNNVASDGLSNSAGKRQSGDATKDERPSRDDVAVEGAGGYKGKRKAGRPRKRDTMSPIGREDAIGMDVGSSRTKKHKADRTTKLEMVSAPPREDIAENGASIIHGMPKPVGAKKNEVISDEIEKGGASSRPGEPQVGQTVGKEPVRDALPVCLPGHVAAKHNPGRRKELELSPEASRFAHKSVANGAQLTQRRGRGRPRKDAGVVDGRYEPDRPAPGVCPPSEKQRTASGAAATARNEDDGLNEPEGDPVTSEDWNDGRNQAPESSEESGAHLTSDGGVNAGSTHARVVP